MPWIKWALVPDGVAGKTKHYWGMPPEVAPDSPRQDMPPARVLLIERSEPNAAVRAQQDLWMKDFLRTASEKGMKVEVKEEEESDGVHLYRYAEDGVFAGDTYHDNPDSAFEQAAWEYDSDLEWCDIPEHLAEATIDEQTIKRLLGSLPS